MKNISFLYSASKSLFPKTGLLLENGTVATVDHSLVDEKLASEISKPIIANTTIENVIWWWPPGNAFREIYGVPEFAILNLFKDFGFNISDNARLNHQQVEEEGDTLKNYIELKISVTDEHYDGLVAQYGNVKVS